MYPWKPFNYWIAFPFDPSMWRYYLPSYWGINCSAYGRAGSNPWVAPDWPSGLCIWSWCTACRRHRATDLDTGYRRTRCSAYRLCLTSDVLSLTKWLWTACKWYRSRKLVLASRTRSRLDPWAYSSGAARSYCMLRHSWKRARIKRCRGGSRSKSPWRINPFLVLWKHASVCTGMSQHCRGTHHTYPW